MIRSALTTLFMMLPLGVALAQEPADLVLRGGRFYPVSSPEAIEGSLAVRDGRIVYLGGAEGVGAHVGDGTRIVELEGRTVTPGLIDAHSHLLSLGAALERVDLVGTLSYEEVIERVRERAAETPVGSWVQGRGWDQNDWPETAFPHHTALSAAVPDHPVWMARIDGHAALLNAKAMEMLGVSAASVDPVGGRFERDEIGEPTGVLVDTAMAVGRGIPSASISEREGQIVAAAHHCLERGLTTVTELGIGQETFRAYRGLRQRGELPIRAALYLSGNDAGLLAHWFERGPELDSEARLQVRGIKLYSDGALGSRGAALVEPYTDDPGNNGLLITGGREMRDICTRALETGYQVATHAIGDRGNLVTLDAFEACFGEPRSDARFRIEHAQVMRLADIERMARLGIIASMQPTHATSDMPWAEDRVGPDRILGGYAWRKVLDAGGRLALGSDFPVERADPRLGLYSAVSRADLDGAPVGGWYPEELLDRHEALRGFTLDAAYSLFLEDEVGSLEVGKRADLVIFAEDIMTVDMARIPQIPVDMTLVEGEIVFEREDAR